MFFGWWHMPVKCNGLLVSEWLIPINGSNPLIHWARKKLFWCQHTCWAINHPLQDTECPVWLLSVFPPVSSRARDMTCCVASRCQRLKVHGKEEKMFQRKELFPAYQAIAEALGSSPLKGDGGSGPDQCHGTWMGVQGWCVFLSGPICKLKCLRLGGQARNTSEWKRLGGGGG